MKIVRLANLLLLIALIAGAIITYGLKHQAEVAADGIAHIQASIAGEKDRIRTLNAEWSFLSQPARLEAVVKEHAGYFQLLPFVPDQLASINDIPMRTTATVAAASGMPPIPTNPANDTAVKATLARIAPGGALRAR